MATETLRPNGAGAETYIHFQGPSSSYHYDKVDEASSDGMTTYVADDGKFTYYRDLYNLPSHSVGSGTINYIKVYAVARTDDAFQASLKIVIQTNDIAYESSAFTVTTAPYAWQTKSNQWTNNPKTGNPWTWDEIDALQIGVSLRSGRSDSSNSTYCTQLYVEIDYTPGVTIEAPLVAIGSEGKVPSLNLDRVFSSPLVAVESGPLVPAFSLGSLVSAPLVSLDAQVQIPSLYIQGRKLIIHVITTQYRKVQTVTSQYRKVKSITSGG